jgi:hypothetical protein
MQSSAAFFDNIRTGELHQKVLHRVHHKIASFDEACHLRVQVSLMVPWIAEADQKVLFKDNVHFKTPEEQVRICRFRCMWRRTSVKRACRDSCTQQGCARTCCWSRSQSGSCPHW